MMATDKENNMTATEKYIIDFKNSNKQFLIDFHKLYFGSYRDRGVYKQHGYVMLTDLVTATKIKGYSNFEEFHKLYLIEIGKGNYLNGYRIYYNSLSKFVKLYNEEVKQLLNKYNKKMGDIDTAFLIKNVFQFYEGFLCEKLLKEMVSRSSIITTEHITEEQQREYDLKYSIDIDIAAKNGKNRMGIQLKQLSYMYKSKDTKLYHISKLHKWEHVTGETAWYIYCKDLKPYYHKDIGYVISEFEALDMRYKAVDFEEGSWEQLGDVLETYFRMVAQIGVQQQKGMQ